VTQPIRVCLVNRNFPPEKGATGHYAEVLVEYLRRQDGIEVRVITVGPHQDHEKTSYVRGLYKGRVRWRRMISALIEGFLLIRKAKGVDADFYIVMTDPSFLNFWASLLLRKCQWALWTMDLYPEAFVASKSISANNLAYVLYQKVLRRCQPDLLISLGAAQRDYLQEVYYPEVASVITPIGISKSDVIQKEKTPPFWSDKTKVIFGYIGTIGEAHDAEQLIALGKSLDPVRHTLILSGGGVKAELVAYALKDQAQVHILDHVEATYMGYIDVHIATLLPPWTHICVPSKALSAIDVGAAVLFIGHDKSDTWQYIKEAGWIISEGSDIASFLAELDIEILAHKKEKAHLVRSTLTKKSRNSFNQIETIIRNLNNSK